ncbi:hypothetical protein TRV_04173 [Trichophyton verrucosum HKI 0517]|uniref:Uncharacterized protein n=1 Tax=Trichophyton verrucosum (strain HKI 0517) TaxID=663202 RepID=D4DAM5_TRIVH|nr:uncharacterized protein TRV_04173 [Trichophyton verrucosum HKI 0517]EFE41097.1 hypothetical protein TRV_04173 [Trichophyton verrucosum HKI 0517]
MTFLLFFLFFFFFLLFFLPHEMNFNGFCTSIEEEEEESKKGKKRAGDQAASQHVLKISLGPSLSLHRSPVRSTMDVVRKLAGLEDSLTDETLAPLKNYKYSSVDKSYISRYILKHYVLSLSFALVNTFFYCLRMGLIGLLYAMYINPGLIKFYLVTSSGMPLSSFCRYGSLPTWSPCLGLDSLLGT